jgi:hypothetical protein
MLVIMDKIKVFIDFHIYAILEFDILIGYPLENLIKEKPSYRSLSKEFRKTASATHLEIPMVEHHPNNELFEEVKFISPFVLLEFSCEMEHSSPPSLKPKSCLSSHPSIVLDSDRDSTLVLHNISFESKNFLCHGHRA